MGAVRVISGASALTGLESPVFGTLSFSDGLIRRRIFRDFLRDQATVYLASGTRLRAAVRALPGGMARDPRALLAELMAHPASQETEAGLACPLPAGLGPEDVLAVGAEGDTLLVSLSQRFADRLTAAGPEGEQAACYSMVVTLCEALGMTRVRFFFGGRVAETLAGSIFWSGEFMLDRSLIDDNRG